MDLRPLHPRHAPGGLSDAFVQGVEVSSSKNDPQWEGSYQRMLRSGYRVFPAFGSDSHDATSVKQGADARKGATICWVARAHARRADRGDARAPLLLRVVAAAGAALPDAPGRRGRVGADGRARRRTRRARGDQPAGAERSAQRERRSAPRAALRSRSSWSTRAAGCVHAEACTRSAEGRDVCRLELPVLHVDDGALYPRIRMNGPNPKACRSTQTPDLLPNCDKLVIGSAIYVNWDRYLETTPYRVCRFGAEDTPCEEPGCLPPAFDRDQDGYPDGCDVCPDLADPTRPTAIGTASETPARDG